MSHSPTLPSASANELSIAHRETRKPNEVSWFRLDILFCDIEVRDHLFHYDPTAIRKQELAKTTIIFCLDRKESPEQNRNELMALIKLLHPRVKIRLGNLDGFIHGVGVRTRYDSDEKGEPGIRVRVWGLIEQLRQTETYGLEAVSPDLFGTGGNELHVLMRKEEDWAPDMQQQEDSAEEDEDDEDE